MARTKSDYTLSFYQVDPEDDTRFAEMDNLVKAPVVISQGHHEIHEGDTFKIVSFFNLVNSGDTKLFLIKTPTNGKQNHTLWFVSSDDKVRVDFYKAPTVTANGTDVTSKVFNCNENIATTTSSLLYEDPTVTNDGTIRDGDFLDKNTPSRSVNELVLAENTDYLIKVTARKSDADTYLKLEWYEHTPE